MIKDGVRVVNDSFVNDSETYDRESLYHKVIQECGFKLNPERRGVWVHSKDDNFSTQYNINNLKVYLEYDRAINSYSFDPALKPDAFISELLTVIRSFYKINT
jgi:hypothetical protein